jgi:uncharacterized protein (DUF433 family)
VRTRRGCCGSSGRRVLGGEPRIEGHRIGVYDVYQQYVDDDRSPEAIADSYGLSVAEGHAALAYAFNNPDTIRAIESRRREADARTTEERVRPEDR